LSENFGIIGMKKEIPGKQLLELHEQYGVCSVLFYTQRDKPHTPSGDVTQYVVGQKLHTPGGRQHGQSESRYLYKYAS
jgi:hypothetical protein